MEESRYIKRNKQGDSSPHLLRSKSGSTAAMPSSLLLKTSSSIYLKSGGKKMKKEEDAAADHGGSFVRFLPRSMSKVEAPRRKRSASTSPSAWALSPGRSPKTTQLLKSPAAIEKVTKEEERSGGRVSGVLKYLRHKKVSPLLEEENHQFRLVYNRLLQWRFANARAEASMAAVKRAAQGKVLNGWNIVSVMRKLSVENRSEIEKMKQRMKLYHIVRSEMGMLNEWWRIEAKNVEAVGRVLRKLSAISLCLPLVQNAQGDVMAVYDAISTTAEVMDNIKAIIKDMDCQVEKTCFLATELSVMLKQYKQIFQELEIPVVLVASLEGEEKSLRVHHMQMVNKESH